LNKPEIIMLPVSALIPWPANPRKNEDAAPRLALLLKEHPFDQPIVCCRDYMIVKGHTRLKAALLNGMAEVPVIVGPWSSMDDPKAVAAALADNRSAEWAEWDFAELKNILTELDTGAMDMEITGYNSNELEQMMNWLPPEKEVLSIPEKFMVLIECKTESEQKNLLERFMREGLQCRALIS
jgi:ParB-like chromosome segregation protein Spo0J